MASNIVYIGRRNRLCGKRVFEILARLKNFGVGRVLVRNSFKEEYPGEEIFYKIHEVDPQMDDELAHGRIWVEEVFKGRKYPKIREIQPYHPDYALVPKHLEPDFDKFPILGKDLDHLKLLPKYYDTPPVMAEYINRKRLGFFPNINLTGLKKEVDGYDRDSLKQFRVLSKYPMQVEDREEFDYWYRTADEDNGEKPTVPSERIYLDKYKEGIRFDVK